MEEIVNPKQGLATADNNRFLRQWYEVDIHQIKFDATSISDAKESGAKWFPYNKGGAFRRWYGNYDYVVNWENDGQEIRNFVDDKGKQRSRPQNVDSYFKAGITWSAITSGKSSFRYQPGGMVFDHAAYTFVETNYFLLALLNSAVSESILKILNPTINSGSSYIGIIPVLNSNVNENVIKIAEKSIRLSMFDDSSFEVSLNFKKHKLL